METIKQEFEYKIYPNIDGLTPDDRELMLAAVKQLDFAYAPYSHFHVGSAVRLKDGSLYVGSNQENASYPLCMCGERVALYNASANNPSSAPKTLAITVKSENTKIDKPASPCGACRQVISEYESRYNEPIRILLKSDGTEIYEINSVADLLPLGFNNSFL